MVDIVSWVVLIGIIIFLLILLVTVVVHVWWRLPFVPTPMALVNTMVRMAELKDNEVVYDLGAGDGRILLAAKRANPTVRATGFEIALGVWMLGRLRLALARSDAKLFMRDLTKQDLSNADVIFTYLTPEFMLSLIPKFQRELKPGTRILSHAFTFKDRTPDRVEIVPALWSGKTKVYLYVWK